MDERIDLTRNRDFSKVVDMRQSSRAIMGLRFPWGFAKRSSYEKDEIVKTGTKKEREIKKRHELYKKELSCECCGADYSNLPWKMAGGLCKVCDDFYEADFKQKQDFVIQILLKDK